MGLDNKERDCERPRCVVIGAGPAGLTAAYELSRNGVNAVVLEQDDIVGGISRTVEYNGYRFDIGGHRFFSKVPLINQLWGLAYLAMTSSHDPGCHASTIMANSSITRCGPPTPFAVSDSLTRS